MPLCRSPLTLRLALFSRSRTAAVEIPRFILHRRRSEFLPDGVPGGFSVRLVRPTAKGAYAPDEVIISMPRRGARTHSGGKAAVGRVRVCESTAPLPSPFPPLFPRLCRIFMPFSRRLAYHITPKCKFMMIFYALHLSFAAAQPTAERRPPTADRRLPTADRRPPTADRKKALPFREAPFGTIQLHQPGGQVMSRPAST